MPCSKIFHLSYIFFKSTLEILHSATFNIDFYLNHFLERFLVSIDKILFTTLVSSAPFKFLIVLIEWLMVYVRTAQEV